MMRAVLLLFLGGILSYGVANAQNQKPAPNPPANTPAPRSDDAQTAPSDSEPYKDEDGLIHRANPGSSSSKAEPVDLAPPVDDSKLHPNSDVAVREAEDAAGLLEGDELGGIQEFHPWDPHKAEKDVEVGDFYFKRKNYRAALDRYQEALYYKNNDAVATFRQAVCQEKLGEGDDARKSYTAYLTILPEGPFAAEAKDALARLGSPSDDNPAPKPHPKQAKSALSPTN
jgi:tetratricopeptide (TPR) repeat protein